MAFKWYYYTPYLIQKLPWPPVRALLHIFAGFEVRGLENLRGMKSNFIFASNHTSELDIIILPAAVPFWSGHSPLYYVSRGKGRYTASGLRQIIYGGIFFTFCGGHPINSGLKDYEQSLANHIRILEDGKNIYVFPEGHITRDGKLGQAHGGAAYLSERTGRPILPVGITGLYRMSLYDFLLFRRKIVVTFGKPIYPDELKKNADAMDSNKYKLEAEYVMKRVNEALVG